MGADKSQKQSRSSESDYIFSPLAIAGTTNIKAENNLTCEFSESAILKSIKVSIAILLVPN